MGKKPKGKKPTRKDRMVSARRNGREYSLKRALLVTKGV